jgi:hypothetical protein
MESSMIGTDYRLKLRSFATFQVGLAWRGDILFQVRVFSLVAGHCRRQALLN